MSDLVSELARKLAHEHAPQGCTDIEDTDAAEFARVLREAGLERLIQAGQAMRAQFEHEMTITGPWTDWDAALAAFREAVKR
jgi:hypothetical protein